jgi:hypothetical protein
MTVTAADFLADYPEFNGIDPSSTAVAAIVARFIAEDDDLISDSAFGNLRDRALQLHVAHRLAVRYKIAAGADKTQTLPGVMTSQNASASGLSFTVATSAMVTGDNAMRASLARTNYGLEYLALIDGVVASMHLTGSDT